MGSTNTPMEKTLLKGIAKCGNVQHCLSMVNYNNTNNTSLDNLLMVVIKPLLKLNTYNSPLGEFKGKKCISKQKMYYQNHL
jgi:hypothetical protein